MLRILLVLLSIALTGYGFCLGQASQIGGVVNAYAQVVSIAADRYSATVVGSVGLSAGDRVMVVQMQGADIDPTNAPSYGSVTDYRSAGNFELNRIRCIANGVVEFGAPLVKTYDPAQRVQIVKVPEFRSATVTTQLTCPPWDGMTGGIAAVWADTLTLSAQIDVTGRGFRAGVFKNSETAPSYYVTDYVGTVDASRYAAKGEGIAYYGIAPMVSGRGAPANGGGGGNNHNAGGGGGAGFGCGGNGGWAYYWPEHYSGDHRQTGGIGGHGIPYDALPGRIFLGGGGGAGQGNNNAATDGAAGGGIVLIVAKVLRANGWMIKSRGDVARSAAPDGAGGGGGGGTIILSVDMFTGALNVDAAGGDGGSCGVAGQDTGPGGGGGGGAVLLKGVSIPAGVVIRTAGGLNGTSVNNGDQDPAGGPAYGSTPGCPGKVLSGFALPEDPAPIVAVDAGSDVSICDTGSVLLNAMLVGFPDNASVQWSPPVGLSDPSIRNPVANPEQTTKYYVTVTVPGFACQYLDSVTVRVGEAPSFAIEGPNVLCYQETGALSVSRPYAHYQWSTGDTTKTISVQKGGTYSVVVTDSNGCSAQRTVSVAQGLQSVSIDGVSQFCEGDSTTLTIMPALMTYHWSTGASGRSIVVKKSGIYSARVTDSLGCFRDVAFAVTVVPAPVTDIGPDINMCQGDSRQLVASGGVSYEWSPTEGLSCADCPDPIASPSATTTYRVRVSNALGCSSIDSVTIYVTQAAVHVGPDSATWAALTIDDAGLDAQSCKEIALYNSDTVPHTIDGVTLLHNSVFSCPPGQFPMTLPPRGSAPITICFATANPGSFGDTLTLLDVCPSVQVYLFSSVDVGDLTGSVCQTRVQVRMVGRPVSALKVGSPYPNPSQSEVSVPIVLQYLSAADAGVDCGALYDAVGVEVKQGIYSGRASARMPGYEQGVIRLDVGDVAPGTYFFRLLTSQGLIVVPVVVVH